MAVAKRKTVTPKKRRTPVKKKMSITAKVAIGVGTATALYLIYDNFIKPKTGSGGIIMPPQITPQGVINQAQQMPPNIMPPQPAPKPPSPRGTPANKQSWSRIIKYNEKSGEVETLQILLNRVSKAYGTPLLDVDGDFGSKTQAKKLSILGTSPVNLGTAYKITKKQLETKNAPPDIYDALFNTAFNAFSLMY